MEWQTAMTAIATSGLVSAVVSAIFKWWSDADQERRRAAYGVVSGALAEAYKREADVYLFLWEKLYALQQACTSFQIERSMAQEEAGSKEPRHTIESLRPRGKNLMEAAAELTAAMDSKRPFFHNSVYKEVEALSAYAQDQFMQALYPALQSLGKKTSHEEFEYLKSIEELGKRIEAVSETIRNRLFAAPWRAGSASWKIWTKASK
jgi:hypothetical protein